MPRHSHYNSLLLGLLLITLFGVTAGVPSPLADNDPVVTDPGEFQPGHRFDPALFQLTKFAKPFSLAGYRVRIDAETGELIILDRSETSTKKMTAGDEPNWDPLGSGVDGFVFDLISFGGELVAAGSFLQAGGAPANRVARWDGASWSPLGGGFDNTVLGLAVAGGELYAAGLFTMAEGLPAAGVVRWDGAAWQPIGTGLTGSGGVALTVTDWDGKLVVGGIFEFAGGVPAKNIAAWDGVTWSALTIGLNDFCLASRSVGGDLIAGGAFSLAGGVPAIGIARWDGVTWSPLGAGLDDYVWAIEEYGGEVIAGGQFGFSGAVPLNRIARFDGVSWHALDSGVDNPVLGLAVYDADLIVAGAFETAGPLSAIHVARWDGAVWDTLGGGMNSTAFCLETIDTTLFSGGSFTEADGSPVGYIAQWRCEFPTTPTGVTATAILCDRITVTWSDSDLETGYRIQRNGLFAGEVGAGVLTYDDFAAPVGAHTYTVSAINACGESDLSTATPGERHELPANPVSLVASDTSCAIVRIDWPVGVGATGYRVYRDGALVVTTGGGTLFYEDAPSPGTYSYSVASVNICGWADSVVTSGTRLFQTPAKPSTLTASDTSCSVVRLDWSSSANAEHYVVYRDGMPIATVLAIKTFYNAPASGGDHLFGVAAENSCGRSDSVTATGTILPPPPPSPVTVIASDTSCSLVRIDWSPEAGADSFRVYRDGALIATVPGGTLFVVDTPPSGAYTYGVASGNSCGYSVPAETMGKRLDKPPPPASLTASDSSCSIIRLDWSDVPGADSFHVYRNAVHLTSVESAVRFLEDGVVPGSYSYEVTASNKCGVSIAANTTGIVLPPAPTAPVLFTASDTSCSIVRLDWSAAADADSYLVYRDGAKIASLSVPVTDYEDLLPAGSYAYELFAINRCGQSGSVIATGTILEGAPDPPTGLVASDTSCSVVLLTWSPSTGADEHRVYRDAQLIETLGPSASAWIDSPASGTYAYIVTAANECGELPSLAANGTVLPAAPTAPLLVTASDTSCAFVRIDWNASADADSYVVHGPGGPIAVLPAATMFYEDMKPPGVYEYGVVAQNSCGLSGPAVAAGEVLPGRPAAPAFLTASDTSCSLVRLDWNASANADKYRIVRDGAVLVVVSGGVLFYNDGSAPMSAVYSVAAGNECGWSDSISAEGRLLPGIPIAPAPVTASDSSCAIVRVEWPAVPDAEIYRLYRDGVLLEERVSSGGLTEVFTDGSAIGQHEYGVAAGNACGFSMETIAAGTRLPGRPTKPGSLSASDSSCSIVRIDWAAVPDAHSYSLYRDDDEIALLSADAAHFIDQDADGRHEYELVASNTCGQSDRASVTGERLTLPDAPVSISASDSVCSLIRVNWSPVEDADRYRLFRDGELLMELTGGVNHFDDPADPGTFTYTVESGNDCGWSAGTSTEGTLLPGRLDGPESFLASDTSCAVIALSWNGVDGATAYRIYRDDVQLAELGATADRYTDFTAPGVHQYRISALNDCGESPDAAAEGLVLPAAPPPPELQRITTDECSADFRVAWEASASADSYRVYRDSEIIAHSGGSVLFVDLVNEPAGIHTYGVTAGSKCGWSEASELEREVLVVPEGPAWLVASDSSCSFVRLDWPPVDGADRFLIRREGDVIGLVDGLAQFYEDKGADAGAFEYTVSAINPCGGTPSDPAVGTRLPGRLEPPATIAASDTSCSLSRIDWAPVAGASRYLLTQNGLAIDTIPAGSTTYEHNWSSGVHAYGVAAGNACGWSDTVYTTGVILQGTPVEPRNFSASNDRCDGVLLTWLPVGFDILAYALSRDGEEIAELTGADPEFVDLLATGRHEYTLRARGMCGLSPPAVAAGEKIFFAPPPALLSPFNGAVFSLIAPVSLEWTEQPGAEGYAVQLASDPDFLVIDDEWAPGAGVNSVVLDSQDDGRERALYWRVATVNPCGTGEYSHARRLDRVAEPGTAEFSISGGNVAFDHDPLNDVAGGNVPDPDPTPVTLKNSGKIPFEWFALPTESWLVVSPSNGVLEPGVAETLWVQSRPGTLPGGEYEARIAIRTSGQDGPLDTLTIELNIKRYQPGDIDGNDLLNLSDLDGLINHVLDVIPVRAVVLRAGLPDVNGDKRIDVSDVVFLSRLLAANAIATDPAVKTATDGEERGNAARIRIGPNDAGPGGGYALSIQGTGEFRAAMILLSAERGDLSHTSIRPAAGFAAARETSNGGNRTALVIYSMSRSAVLLRGDRPLDIAVFSGGAVPGSNSPGVLSDNPVRFVSGEMIDGSGGIRILKGSEDSGVETIRPGTLFLGRARPNPFRSEALFSFGIPSRTTVEVAVFTTAGRRVKLLQSGDLSAGFHEITWNGRNTLGRRLGPGVYFIRLVTPEGTRTQRVVLVR